jgi:hypothetical protein
MKKLTLLSACLAASGLAVAQDTARVVSSSPILQQVAVPRQVCNNEQGCTTQNFYENQPVAYTVVYEYGGKQYTVQMPHDPGPTLQLQITPLVAATQATLPASVTYSQAAYPSPAYVIAPPLYYDSGYYGYYAQPNYLPLAAFLGLGWAISSQNHWHHRGR